MHELELQLVLRFLEMIPLQDAAKPTLKILMAKFLVTLIKIVQIINSGGLKKDAASMAIQLQ